MKGRKWVPALVTVAIVPGAACQRSPQSAPATGEVRAASAPPVAASWHAFEPPDDGRLTAAQVERYVAVRRRAVALSMASPSPGAAATDRLVDFAVSERRAVNDLGQDIDEYRWVSARIAEASRPAPDALGGLTSAIEASARKGRDQVLEKAARDQVPVAHEDERAPDDAARAYNRDLVDRYRAQLDGTVSPPPPTRNAPPKPGKPT
jgi:hypothetical protein